MKYPYYQNPSIDACNAIPQNISSILPITKEECYEIHVETQKTSEYPKQSYAKATKPEVSLTIPDFKTHYTAIIRKTE